MDYLDKVIVICSADESENVGKVGIIRGRNPSDDYHVQLWTKQRGESERRVLVRKESAKFFNTVEDAQAYVRRFKALK